MRASCSLRTLICALLTVLYATGAAAYMIPYRQYTVKDGLIHSRVYRVLQGKLGYLWCSTDYGLSRFDGYDFHNYPSERDFSGAALALGLAPDGTIWFSTSMGELYYLKDNRITRYAELNKLLQGKIINIRVDEQDRIWLINEKGQAGYIKQFKYTAFDRLKSEEKIHCILPYKGGTFIGTSQGIYHLNAQHALLPFTSYKGAVYSLEANNDGNVFFGSDGEIYLAKNAKAFERLATLPERLPVILLRADKSGKLWCTTTSPSLFRIDKGKVENLLPYLHLQNTFVNDIFCDAVGNVVLATYGMGLYSIGNLSLVKYTVADGLTNNTVTVVKEDPSGKLYAGTFGGVSVLSEGKFYPWQQSKFMDDEVVNDILFHDKEIWVASPIAVYRFLAGSMDRRQPGGLAIFDNGDGMLMGDYNGVRKSVYSQNNFNRKLSGALLKENRVNRIIRDESGGLWFATRKGIVYRNKDGIFSAYLQDHVISDICEHRGVFWAATPQGLWYYQGGSWHQCQIGDKGSTYSISALASATDGTLWIGTQHGLLYFDGKRVNSFKGSIDLMTEDISSIYEDRNRDIWIGTETGLFRLSLLGKPGDIKAPGVIITNVRADQWNDVLSGTTLELPYYKNRAQISFLAMDYAVPEDIEYEYSMVEKDQLPVWSRTQNRTVEFSSLSSGSYTFMVRARRMTSEQISAIKKISIKVLTPFWQTWWFLAVSAVVLLSAIFYFIRRRILSIQKKERLRAQRYSKLLQLKQQAIHSLISPHFVFNALSSVQHFINKSDKLSANRYITRFASLIRRTMDDSSRFTVSLKNEIERLELYLSLEKLRLGDKLTYAIFVDEHLNPSRITIPSMLIQPLVENAIWHGIMPKDTDGHITISFYLHETRLKVIVEDNGIGIEESKRFKTGTHHNSRGLEITAKRIRLLGKMTRSNLLTNITQLTHNDTIAGTRVELELPLDMDRSLRMKLEA